MDLWNSRPCRLLCAEPLEGRWLLSGLAAPSVGDAEDSNASDGDAPAATLEPLELPDQVAAALQARFPGARLVEAELDTEDGAAAFYVTAEFDGETVEVTISPIGEVLEIEVDESPPVTPGGEV